MKMLLEEYEKTKKEKEEFEKKLNSYIKKYVDLCKEYGELFGNISYHFNIDKKILIIEKTEEDWHNEHKLSITSKLGFEIRIVFNASYHSVKSYKTGIIFCDRIIELGNAIRSLDDELINEIGIFK